MNRLLYERPGCVLSENGECMLYNGAVRRDGYCGISYRDPVDKHQTGANAHRIAKMVQNFTLHRTIYLADGDASHLCHNKQCVRPDHVNIEPSQVNQSRKVCIRLGRCTRHPKGDGGEFHPDCLLELRRPGSSSLLCYLVSSIVFAFCYYMLKLEVFFYLVIVVQLILEVVGGFQCRSPQLAELALN